MPPSHILRTDDRIIFSSMDSPFIVGQFLTHVFQAEKLGIERLFLDFSRVEAAFPNALVPVSGIIDFYHARGMAFEVVGASDFLKKTRITSPLIVSDNTDLLENTLNKVWRFDSADDVFLIHREFIRCVSQEVICEAGVIDALWWCLSEVMDNVIQHSGKSYGFVMGQFHKRSRHISFCIYDNGQGIFNSFKNSPHRPKNAAEAIEMAIKEQVTRDKKIGQGNGLWGLSEIVKNNEGRLAVTSGSGFLALQKGLAESRRDDLVYLANDFGGCTIDFQLNYRRTISLTDALRGHRPVNYRTEDFEDDAGVVEYPLAKMSGGTGTRKAGEKLRNDIINLYNDAQKGIVIDFSDIVLISSSFADELVGKLVVHFGFVGFNQIVRLKNMNQQIQPIVSRSVAQRMAESFT